MEQRGSEGIICPEVGSVDRYSLEQQKRNDTRYHQKIVFD
jgi:hypothetical protein